MRKCWICGDPADSAEHMYKAADFSRVFGEVTQNSPVYRQSRGEPNLPIKGKKAGALKYSPSICKKCNNERTQRHDLAWSAFVEFVVSSVPPFQPKDRVPLEKIYGANAAKSAADLQLYFVKQLGCMAVEKNYSLPLGELAHCILEGVTHPRIGLHFFVVPRGSTRNKGLVGMDGLEHLGETMTAHLCYLVDTLGIVASYEHKEVVRVAGRFGWHPADGAAPFMAA